MRAVEAVLGFLPQMQALAGTVWELPDMSSATLRSPLRACAAPDLLPHRVQCDAEERLACEAGGCVQAEARDVGLQVQQRKVHRTTKCLQAEAHDASLQAQRRIMPRTTKCLQAEAHDASLQAQRRKVRRTKGKMCAG